MTFGKDYTFKYIPFLFVGPSEMGAIQELPEKDKDLLLPLFPLRGWVGSHKLKNTPERIRKSIGDRRWIADIDSSFLQHETYLRTGVYPREVFHEIEALLDSSNGYENWCQYVASINEAIPVLQLHDIYEFDRQIVSLEALGRGLVVKFTRLEVDSGLCFEVINRLVERDVNDLLVMFDYGHFFADVNKSTQKIADLVSFVANSLPQALISISGSSFPFEFSGYENGENSIYERLLFNDVKGLCPNARLVYSDRGSARAEKIKGGGGTPAPRIDYPLDNDWRFIRDNYADAKDIQVGEKQALFTSIAQRIIASNYWEPDLLLWGTQLITVTSQGDEYGIDNATKATAARINIHLHRQLHYGSNLSDIDTDDDWED
ncbi:MAG: beta family protein [Gammaproteobacteria bacterium]|nr:beta family protein [Gammaproteobacteria bacterium]